MLLQPMTCQAVVSEPAGTCPPATRVPKPEPWNANWVAFFLAAARSAGPASAGATVMAPAAARVSAAIALMILFCMVVDPDSFRPDPDDPTVFRGY